MTEGPATGNGSPTHSSSGRALVEFATRRSVRRVNLVRADTTALEALVATTEHYCSVPRARVFVPYQTVPPSRKSLKRHQDRVSREVTEGTMSQIAEGHRRGSARSESSALEVTHLKSKVGAMKRITQRSVVVFVVACLGGLLFIGQAGAQGGQVAQEESRLGDAERGKDLFRGAESFENGGPPCMACHSAGGLGALGGGALGPDLTGAFDRWGGENGLLGTDAGPGILDTLSFPTMLPVFGERQLTPSERADIAAFLEESLTAGRTSGAVVTLFLIGAAGTVVMLAFFGFAWRRRLNGVRKPMVAAGSAIS